MTNSVSHRKETLLRMVKNEQNQTEKKFSCVAEEWTEKKRVRLKQTSMEKYENLLNKYILDKLGAINTTEFCAEIFENALEDISMSTYNNKLLSISTMKSIVYIINSIIKYGAKHGYNNIIPIQFEYRTENNTKVSVITHTDQSKIIQHILEQPSINNLGILLSITTGLRIGEICALRFKDVDFENKIIHVCKTAHRVKSINGTKLVVSSPKTYTSNRYIPMPSIVIEYLESNGIISASNPDNYLLTNNIRPYEPRTLQYSFKRLLKQCDIDEINFHSLRHTFATNCVEVGFEVKTLSEILGHSSVSFTLNRYVHSSIDQKTSQMKLLDTQYKSYFCE